jgi:hypothetical protein
VSRRFYAWVLALSSDAKSLRSASALVRSLARLGVMHQMHVEHGALCASSPDRGVWKRPDFWQSYVKLYYENRSVVVATRVFSVS